MPQMEGIGTCSCRVDTWVRPLRRDTEVVWDIYKEKGHVMRWCEMFAGNGWDRLLAKK